MAVMLLGRCFSDYFCDRLLGLIADGFGGDGGISQSNRFIL